jgi:hypothetical protein
MRGITKFYRNDYKYFVFMENLLKPHKSVKIELLLPTTIVYSACNIEAAISKRMRILLDSGCAAILITQCSIGTLKPQKRKIQRKITKLVNSVPTESVE